MNSKKNTFCIIITTFCLVLLFLSGCFGPGADEDDDTVLKVGIIWSDIDENFFNAAQLAIDEINKTGITVLGMDEFGDDVEITYTLKPVFKYEDFSTEKLPDNERIKKMKKEALELARDDKVIAIIGHFSSETAMSASIIYNQHEKLFISPSATAPALTEHGFEYVFRIIPSDKEIAHEVAHFVKKRFFSGQAPEYIRMDDFEEIMHNYSALNTEYRNFIKDSYVKNDRKCAYVLKQGLSHADQELLAELLIYVARDQFGLIVGEQSDYGKGFSSVISAVAGEEFINMLPSKNYFPRKNNFSRIIGTIRTEPVSAIFFAGQFRSGYRFIKQARQSGITAPIVGGDSFASARLKTLGDLAENVYFTDFFDENSTNPAFMEFHSKFIDRFGDEPDLWAVQAYESVNLLAHAIELTQSADPEMLASGLRYMTPWEGIAHNISFTENGDLAESFIVMKTIVDGNFTVVE